MFKNKRVLLLNFPLLDVGGIVTWAHQIMKGYKKIGWKADHFYCTKTGRMKVSKTDFTPIGKKYKRGEKIPSRTLGFTSEDDMEYYQEILCKYDYVIFVHPSPHPTKANRNDPGMEHWKRMYTLCDIPKVVVFHDKNWHKTNKWFTDVIDDIDVVLCDQHNFIESVEHYVSHTNKNIKTDWLFFPFEIPEEKFSHDRENFMCMMPQWIKWKNHHLLLPEGKDLITPIHFYNGGMQYHYLVKEDMWKECMYKDHVEDIMHNEDALHHYYGFVTYKDVIEVYKKALASIDITTRTYQNFVHHEGMLYGAITLCTEECRQGPYNHIPDGHYWSVDTNNISKSLNDFANCSENQKCDIREKAYEFVKEHFDCGKVAEHINQIVSSL